MTAQLAMALRDRGQDDATRHAGDRACATLERWVLEVADLKGDDGFTADDVTATLPQWTRDALATAPNAVGAIFQKAARSGAIEPHPEKAPRAATHNGARGRVQRVWRKRVTVHSPPPATGD